MVTGADPGLASPAAGGDQLWVSRMTNPGGIAESVGVSPDGSRVFVTGGAADYETVAYDSATGAQLWISTYTGPGNDFAKALAVSPDGTKVFVTGWSLGQGQYVDYATVAYDAATGNQLWVERYDGPKHRDDTPYAIAVSPDGYTVFVTGTSAGSGTHNDYATIAYHAATGIKLWIRRYNGPGNGDDAAHSIATSPDGTRVFVTGCATGTGGNCDYATIAYGAAAGATLWGQRYDGPAQGLDIANAVAVSPDGTRVVVTGASAGVGTDDDYATISYDSATGSMQWGTRYSGPGSPNNDDTAFAVGISPDSARVFVTGCSFGARCDYETIAYDAAGGTTLWNERYAPGDAAYSLGVSPDGSQVIVTGIGTGSHGYYDYVTVAYDAAAGGTVWADRYDGPANLWDSAYSLAISPDGTKVFVTGYSQNGQSGDDYATVAYEA